ncbi:DUF6973 domain-containing protein [Nocardia sp. NPDC049526]|uniref:DUF6973 domain-containing protein n=1 Tax=Nocardia sp. NPDC049526 TaxID=3364316 RepID=UPI0037882C27
MSGLHEDHPLTVPQVLGWNLGPARDVASIVKRVSGEIDSEMADAGHKIAQSYEYFEGKSGDSVRERGEQDKKDGFTTVDVYEEMAKSINSICETIEGKIGEIRGWLREVEDSDWDLFCEPDGEVLSHQSNWETMKEHWWSPATAVANKELEEFRLTQAIRQALTRIQEADLTGSENLGRLLEKLADSVKQGVSGTPSDPNLAKVLMDYQTETSSSKPVIWPSDGALLDVIRMAIPDFKATLMTEEESRALDNLYSKKGLSGLKDFFDITSLAEDEAKKRYPTSYLDGHGDAFRHTYWNALMTQKFGEDWTQTYTTSHEKIGGNPPHREAMDLYNNEQGRKIGLANSSASAEELAQKVKEHIDNGQAIVLGNPVDPATGLRSRPTITWSNTVSESDTGQPAGVEIPLPGKK